MKRATLCCTFPSFSENFESPASAAKASASRAAASAAAARSSPSPSEAPPGTVLFKDRAYPALRALRALHTQTAQRCHLGAAQTGTLCLHEDVRWRGVSRRCLVRNTLLILLFLRLASKILRIVSPLWAASRSQQEVDGWQGLFGLWTRRTSRSLSAQTAQRIKTLTKVKPPGTSLFLLCGLGIARSASLLTRRPNVRSISGQVRRAI